MSDEIEPGQIIKASGAMSQVGLSMLELDDDGVFWFGGAMIGQIAVGTEILWEYILRPPLLVNEEMQDE